MAPWRPVAPALLLLLYGGCSETSRGNDTVERNGHTVFVMEHPDCDDDGACELSVHIDGTEFRQSSCGPIRIGELVAIDDSGDWPSEARKVVGKSPREAVAFGPPQDGSNVWQCAEATG